MRTKDGKSIQFAFVGFRTEREAEEALKFFNNAYMYSSMIVCEMQRTMDRRRRPFIVAQKRKQGACAALMNRSSNPLVWPSLLKFINVLNPEAKALLETTLMDANREREKIFKGPHIRCPRLSM